MKKLMITAAALMIAVATHAQGSFLFNSRDIAFGNNLTFVMPGGALATGADLFVEVLAGADIAGLKALTPTLPLNRTGAGAGYTNPFSNIYTVPGLATGNAIVGWRAYQGTSYDTSLVRSDLFTSATPVALTQAPTPPNEAVLGVQAVQLNAVPEPATLALGLLGLGSLLMFRRRQ
jgi:hypothetical protein